jgi:predicted ABC-type ATPase
VSSEIPRLRLFAGPNGSGKSSLQKVIKPEFLGDVINPDELEKELKSNRYISMSQFYITADHDQLFDFLKSSSLLKRSGLLKDIDKLTLQENNLHFEGVDINSYWAAVLSDFIRRQWIKQRRTFSFESVMSSPDKIEFLKMAKEQGYRVYLYFIATVDPEINVSRVRSRVEDGGHDVPKDKIISRYFRSIQVLWDAIPICDRAYIFDNSGDQQIWFAEVTSGKTLSLKQDDVPDWFADIMAKIMD